MSTGWSLYIAVVSIFNVVACLWLLWWTARQRAPAAPKSGASSGDAPTTGHEWDGIQEFNTPLPKWWLNLFYLTIAFGFVYFALYPALGNYSGTTGWTSAQEHDQQAAQADALIQPLFRAFADKPLEQLTQDAAALRLGRSVFANHCATCHGSDAQGAKGFPNLIDGDWLWGGEPEQVLTSILDGRNGAMPGLEAVIGADKVPAVAVYVQSLAGNKADPQLAAKGKPVFATLCAACHGVDGRGNPALGAPNLTDHVWLHGGDFNSIAHSIRAGRSGQMPAHRELIGVDRARLAAAWILSQQTASAAGQGGR
jgi:cytochrome c oxidase cbb3-type subunit III